MSGVMSAIGLDAAGTAAAAGAADAAAGAAGAVGTDVLASAAAPSLMDIVGAGTAADAGMADSMAAPSLWGSLTSGLSAGLGSIGSGLDSVGSGIGSLFGSGSADAVSGAPGVGASMSPMPSVLPSLSSTASDGGSGSGLGSWLGNSSNLKNTAVAAGIGLPMLQGVAQQFTLPKYNVQKNANSVMATNPQFNNPNLPQYSMQNTANPYSGNWYNYGATSQPSMYNAMPTPAAKTGGLIGYAQGGRVRGYAMGGAPMMPQQPQQPPMPQAAPPQAPNPLAMAQQRPPMPQGAMPRKPVNPLMLKAAHEVGVAIGEHIKKKRMTPPGRVAGHGGGQDDIVPARLSKDEFVMPADITAHLGDGSSEAGGKRLEKMMHNVRQHKIKNGAGFPPKAKNPLSYLPKGAI